MKPLFIWDSAMVVNVRFINQYRRDMEMDAIVALEEKQKVHENRRIIQVMWDVIRDRGVVLVQIIEDEGDKKYTKYVTWVFFASGETFWGEYFHSINRSRTGSAYTEAVASFNLRSVS